MRARRNPAFGENPLAKRRGCAEGTGRIFNLVVSKKSKKEKKEKKEAAAAAENADLQTEAVAKPAKAPRKRVASSKETGSARPAARKKSGGSKAAKSSSASQDATPSAPAQERADGPTDSDIRIRAYFIAERRTQHSIPGDPSNDWLEARRQLLEEWEAQRRG